MKNILTLLILFSAFFSVDTFAQDRIEFGIFAAGTLGTNPAGTKLEIGIDPDIVFPATPTAAEFNLIIFAPSAQLSGSEIFSVTEDNVNGGSMSFETSFPHMGNTYFSFTFNVTDGIDLSQYGTSLSLAFAIGVSGGMGNVDFSIADESSDIFSDFGITSALNLLGINELKATANPVQLAGVALPVELTSFDVTKKGDQDAMVTWSTSSEQNTSHFEVERSLDNGKNWEKVGIVSAEGNSTNLNNYAFEDKNLKRFIDNNQLIYYRLKTIDFDQSHHYSKTKNIEMLLDLISISVYPNPTVEGVQVTVHSKDKAEELSAIVKDIHGRTMLSQNLGRDRMINQYINFTNLAPGTYFLSVQSDNRVFSTERLIVLDK